MNSCGSAQEKGFRKHLNELLASRGHELWIMGIDSRRQKLTDICGTIEGETLLAVNKRGFFDTDAGFRVSARKVLPLGGKKVDIFLLNKDHYDKSPKALEPLVVHELAHFLEHTEQTVALTDQDKENARAILKSLDERVRRRHTKEWALLLATQRASWSKASARPTPLFVTLDAHEGCNPSLWGYTFLTWKSQTQLRWRLPRRRGG